MPPPPHEQQRETEMGCEWETPIRELEEEDNNMLILKEWDLLREEFFEYSGS
jgi:hypothetical protein